MAKFTAASRLKPPTETIRCKQCAKAIKRNSLNHAFCSRRCREYHRAPPSKTRTSLARVKLAALDQTFESLSAEQQAYVLAQMARHYRACLIYGLPFDAQVARREAIELAQLSDVAQMLREEAEYRVSLKQPQHYGRLPQYDEA